MQILYEFNHFQEGKIPNCTFVWDKNPTCHGISCATFYTKKRRKIFPMIFPPTPFRVDFDRPNIFRGGIILGGYFFTSILGGLLQHKDSYNWNISKPMNPCSAGWPPPPHKSGKSARCRLQQNVTSKWGWRSMKNGGGNIISEPKSGPRWGISLGGILFWGQYNIIWGGVSFFSNKKMIKTVRQKKHRKRQTGSGNAWSTNVCRYAERDRENSGAFSGAA